MYSKSKLYADCFQNSSRPENDLSRCHAVIDNDISQHLMHWIETNATIHHHMNEIATRVPTNKAIYEADTSYDTAVDSHRRHAEIGDQTRQRSKT